MVTDCIRSLTRILRANARYSPKLASLTRSVSSSSSLEASSVLVDAWPRLQERYEELSNDEGIFPLLTTKQHQKFHRDDPSWDANVEDQESNKNPKSKPQAAVLVLLCSVSGVPSVLLTRRANHLNSHASEMSFAGGHFEPEHDQSLADTALREAEEELLPTVAGYLQDHVQVVGQSTPLPSIRGMPVTPILAILWPELTANTLTQLFPGDPSEVDLVFTVSLQELLEGETHRRLPENRFRLTDAPVFPTPHGEIWGLTAYILRPLLHRLYRPIFFGNTARPVPP